MVARGSMSMEQFQPLKYVSIDTSDLFICDGGILPRDHRVNTGVSKLFSTMAISYILQTLRVFKKWTPPSHQSPSYASEHLSHQSNF